MQLTKIIIGEFIVLIASVFIFRSLWTMIDQYFAYSYLTEFLIIGIILTVIGLVIIIMRLNAK
jgi:multisubunit Na+/H+ antiporter MnhG subunit